MSQHRLRVSPEPLLPWSVEWRVKNAFPQVHVNTVARGSGEPKNDVSGNYSSATCSRALVGAGPCGTTAEAGMGVVGGGRSGQEAAGGSSTYSVTLHLPPGPPGASTYPIVSQAVKVDNASALEIWHRRLYQSQY